MAADEEKPGSLRSGVAWSLLTLGGAKALTFVATLILARLLAPSDFGVLAAVLAFITTLEVIGDLGMKATVIYESERGHGRRVQTAFTLNLIFTIVLTAIAVAAAPAIAEFFGAESETDLFRLGALHLLFRGLGNIHDALLLRDMEFRKRLIPEVVSSLARGVAMIALALAGLGASALVIGFLIGSAVWVVAVWTARPFLPNLTIHGAAVRAMVTYGGWATALSLLAGFAQRADAAVIGGALGSRALGLYTIAQRVPELVIGNVTWNLSIVAFPALSQRRDRDDESLTYTTLNLIRYSALFGLTTGAFLAVLAAPLVVVLFSEKWTDAGAIMTPLAIMYGLIAIVFPLGDTFKAIGRQPTMVLVNGITLPATIVAMLLAAPAGVVAVVWARAAMAVAQGLVYFVLITRALDLRFRTVFGMLRPAAAATAGIVLGGALVRVLLPEPTVGPLLLGALAASVLGAVFLRWLARDQYLELRDLLHERLQGLPLVPVRTQPAPPVGSVETEQTVELERRSERAPDSPRS